MLSVKNQAGKILIFFFAAVTLFAGCAPPGPRALLRGRKLLEQGKYSEAVEKLASATVLLGGTNAQAFNYLGLACHLAGQTTEAERAYQKALALNPDLAEVRFNLGCLALDTGRLEQAKSDLTAYTLRRPNAHEGWLKLGLAVLRQAPATPLHLRSSQLASAEKDFSEGLRLSPQNPEGLVGLGLVRVQRGQPTEAAAFFTRALKAQPDYPPALVNLAIVEQQLNQRQAAIETYRQYLALKPAPENADAVRALVRQLEQELAPVTPPGGTARPPQTRTNLTASQAVPTETVPSPTSSKPATTDTTRTSNVTKAQSPENLSGTAPSATTPKVSRPASTSAANAPEVVQVPPDPVIRQAQDTPVVLSGTSAPPKLTAESPATALQTALESKIPRYHYRTPAKPIPGNRSEAERAFAQGVQAYQAQHLKEAIASYRRAVQVDPAFFDAYYNLAQAATKTDNLSLALSTYEAALALRPESSDARYNFALALKRAGCLLDAAAELEKVIAAYPKDSRAHLALGNLYAQQLQQPAKAREHYLKVLDSDPGNPQAAAIRSWLTEPSH